ncbi:g1826 [Coccomyxa elongata]
MLVMLRRDIGNTPDTSKALRMLVHARKINRSGRGGRSDPFKYEIPHGILEEISERVHPPAQLVQLNHTQQVTTTAGAAQREIQTMPELDQHISPRSSDRAAAAVSEDEQAAMSPPLSPSSLNTDQGRPNKYRRIRFARDTSTLDPMNSDSRAQHGSYACRSSTMPLNIPALSEGSTGPGRFTFTQALHACRKEYQGTTAAAPSSKADKGNKSQPQEREALHSSQDSMLSDSNSKMWHFRPAYPVSSYRHPTSHVEGTMPCVTVSACQQEQLTLVAQHNTPLAGTPWHHVSPSTAETCSAFQSERNCCVPLSQNTVQAPGNGSPFWEQAQASSATQRGGQKQSFDKENSAEKRGMTQIQEQKKTAMGSQEAHNAHLHSRTPATNQGPGLQSLAGMGTRAAPPPLFKPPTV